MKIFEIKNISYKYDKYNKDANNILNDISFSVFKKDFIAIIGRNGSGKSTLISHLNGLIKADSGEILFYDKNIYSENYDLKALRFKVGVVFQYPEYQLFADTVIEDICFGAIKKGLSEEEAKNKAIQVMEMLNILYLKDKSPFSLSGGEKRKVAIAGILVMEPEVLIFDEPDAGLDTKAKKDFFEIIKNLNKNNDTTIIFITHNYEDVIEYANRVIVLNDGSIVKDSLPYEIFSDYEVIKKYKIVKPEAVEIMERLKKIDNNIDNTKIKFEDLKNILYELLKK